MNQDTIYAVATGRPPAAIAILRISGPEAISVGKALAGRLPLPGRTGLRALRDPSDNSLLDRALVLCFKGPASATGEDVVELHLHGGRAVIAAVEQVLSGFANMRRAEHGEFTRRALMSGRIDLAEAEGLGDLLEAETEAQRRVAIAGTEGRVSRAVAEWARQCAAISARLEAAIDFAEEDDVAAESEAVNKARSDVRPLIAAIERELSAPAIERLRDGVNVVLSGPPNAGKSSLFNALVGREAAIVTPEAGTTRDRIEAPVSHGGIPYVLIDTAGLREAPNDGVEAIGIDRANQAVAAADIVLWLGDEAGPDDAKVLNIHARADLTSREQVSFGRIAVSAMTSQGIAELWETIGIRSRDLLPKQDQIPLNARHRQLCAEACVELRQMSKTDDIALAAEHIRIAGLKFSRITGLDGIEQMLDALFSRFCLGK